MIFKSLRSFLFCIMSKRGSSSCNGCSIARVDVTVNTLFNTADKIFDELCRPRCVCPLHGCRGEKTRNERKADHRKSTKRPKDRENDLPSSDSYSLPISVSTVEPQSSNICRSKAASRASQPSTVRCELVKQIISPTPSSTKSPNMTSLSVSTNASRSSSKTTTQSREPSHNEKNTVRNGTVEVRSVCSFKFSNEKKAPTIYKQFRNRECLQSGETKILDFEYALGTDSHGNIVKLPAQVFISPCGDHWYSISFAIFKQDGSLLVEVCSEVNEQRIRNVRVNGEGGVNCNNN